MTTYDHITPIEINDNFPQLCGGCKNLLALRFGTKYQCRLFSESIGRHGDDLRIDMELGVLRHEKCLIVTKERKNV